MFLEARLGDLFHDLTEPAHATTTRALTLFPLVVRMRGLIATGSGAPFTYPAFKRLVDGAVLAEGPAPRRVLNTSHHDKASLKCCG